MFSSRYASVYHCTWFLKLEISNFYRMRTCFMRGPNTRIMRPQRLDGTWWDFGLRRLKEKVGGAYRFMIAKRRSVEGSRLMMLRLWRTWTPNNQGRAVETTKGSTEQDRRGSSPHAKMPITNSCRQHKCAYLIARVGFVKPALELRLRHSISGVELSYKCCRRNVSIFYHVQPCFTIYFVLVLLQPPGRLYSLQRYLASLRIMRRFFLYVPFH